MRAVGIIAEYNPFHNGHLYHLRQSLELTGAEVSVAVISGSFTQRGSFAILDKWTRAEMAVRNGVNLVVEMPTLFASGNAGYFAKGGVEILENLGVSYISFGSEAGNMTKLLRISREMQAHKQEINEAVRAAVKEGQAYPRPEPRHCAAFSARRSRRPSTARTICLPWNICVSSKTRSL